MTKSAKSAKNPGAKIEKAKSIKGAGGKRAAGDLPKVKVYKLHRTFFPSGYI